MFSSHGNDIGPGHRLRWQMTANANAGGGDYPVSGSLARRIDEKLDDGRYFGGYVFAAVSIGDRTVVKYCRKK